MSLKSLVLPPPIRYYIHWLPQADKPNIKY